MKNWKRVSGVLCDMIMNVNIKGKVHIIVVRPALIYVRGRYTGVVKGTGTEIGGGRNENATMDVQSY